VTNDCYDEYDELPLSILKLTKDIFDCEFKELVDIDRDIHTTENDMRDSDRPANEI
jgi:hypothetical protein